MAQVPEVVVKDANGVNREVATLTAIAALIGEVQASPTSNTMLDRLKALLTASELIGTRAYTWGSALARTVTATSAQTAAVGADGEYEISVDTDCYVLIGSNPTASATTSRFMAAGTAWTLQLASTDKVGVIRKTADGNLLVLPVA